MCRVFFIWLIMPYQYGTILSATPGPASVT
jgi:hypothetical protein